MDNKYIVILVALACVAGIVLTQPVVFVERVLAPYDPYQAALPQAQKIKHEEYDIAAVARYTGTALVLSKKRYFWGRGVKLAPIDLALGWGQMSNGAVLKKIKIVQWGRFYWWWTSRFPIPRREIETHSANVHFIPANDEMSKQLKRIRKGDLIRFKGYLVNVTDKDGATWKTSTTRADTGHGACEIIWLDELLVLGYDQ